MGQACQMVSQPPLPQLDDETKRIRILYQRLYQRDPSPDETRQGLRFLLAESPSIDGNEGRSLTTWERYGQALLMSNELIFVD
jgi:hypothetical protein